MVSDDRDRDLNDLIGLIVSFFVFPVEHPGAGVGHPEVAFAAIHGLEGEVFVATGACDLLFALILGGRVELLGDLDDVRGAETLTWPLIDDPGVARGRVGSHLEGDNATVDVEFEAIFLVLLKRLLVVHVQHLRHARSKSKFVLLDVAAGLTLVLRHRDDGTNGGDGDHTNNHKFDPRHFVCFFRLLTRKFYLSVFYKTNKKEIGCFPNVRN